MYQSRILTVVDKTLTPSPWTTQMDYLKWTTPKNGLPLKYYSACVPLTELLLYTHNLHLRLTLFIFKLYVSL